MDIDAPTTPQSSITTPNAPQQKQASHLTADAVTSRVLPNGLVRSLVLSYLLRNCYRQTALAFVHADDAARHHMSDDVPSLSALELDHLDRRKNMMDLILDGDVLGGIAIADALLAKSKQDATVQQCFPMVHLRLLCQHFVELVRVRKTIQALSFAQDTIAPLCKKTPGGLPLLQSYLPLLAYQEPELSPIFELVDRRHRETLAEELNDHVFGMLGGGQVRRQSELERLMRHLSLAMSKLEEGKEGVKWTLASVVMESGEES